MPIKGAILIVIFAIAIAVIEREKICEWLEAHFGNDDDIDDKNNFEED